MTRVHPTSDDTGQEAPASTVTASVAIPPHVSVLVPAYNAAERIAPALRTVLGQSLDELEVIVVDDASSDRTTDIVAALAEQDPRVRLIHSKRNVGPGGARNQALEAARGRWIALLDSDDAFLPDRLDRLVRRADLAGADLIADNLLLEQEGEEGGTTQAMLPRDLLAEPRWIDAAAFLEGNLPIPGHPRVSFGFLKPLIRREFLAQNGLAYRDGLRFAEDFDFYLRCLLAGARWLLVPDAGYVYSVRGDSLTARHDAKDLARLRALDRQYSRSLQAHGADPALERAVSAHLRTVEDRLVWRLVLAALKRGRFRRALRLTMRSSHDLRLVVLSLLRDLPQTMRRHLDRRLSRSAAFNS